MADIPWLSASRLIHPKVGNDSVSALRKHDTVQLLYGNYNYFVVLL